MSKKHLAISLLTLGLASVSFCAVPLDTGLFAKKITVTFGGYQSSETLTDFPALVKLSTDIDGFSYGDFKLPNGGDLRFADSDGNLIPHDVDTWNSNGVSTVWVKVPSLSNGAKVYAYYSSFRDLPAVESKDVWDDDYVGVWHLGESALPLKESSETSSDFTTSYGTSIAYAAPGVIGGAVDFSANGQNNSIIAPDHDALDGFSKFTIETWTFQNEHKNNAGIIAKRKEYNQECAYYLYNITNSTTKTIPLCVPTNKNTTADWTYHQVQTIGEWNYLVYTVDMTKTTSNVHGIKNGSSSTWYNSKDFHGTMANCASDLCLGNLGANKTYSFNGKIDEVRISKTVRSDEWVKATYDTITSANFAFYEVGDAPGSGMINPAEFRLSMEVTFSGYSGEELNDFPALVKLSTAIAGFRYSDFSLLGGGDLRFADEDGNILPHEIDTWDTAGVSTVWVKVPSLTKDTKIYAYYGCANPPAASPDSVWDSGYVGVWHLGESGLPMKESTGVSTDFSQSTNTVVYGASGAVGRSVDFSTSYASQYNGLFANDDDDLDGFEDFTIEVWTFQNAFYTDDSKELWAGILGKRAAAKNDESFFVYQNSLKNAGNTLPKYCFNVNGTDGREMLTATTLPVLGQWMHNVYTRNAGTGAINVYFDGTNNVSAVATQQGPVYAGSAPLQLGWVAATYSTFPGKIDEVRISKVVRSAAWIKATHDTITSDDFATYSIENAYVGGLIDLDAFRRKVDVSFTGHTGGELQDFPVLVKLSTNIVDFSYSDFSYPDGHDLCFIDSEYRILPYEIDVWNTNGVSAVWVKVPSFTKNTKITAIYGYENPPSNTPSDVWDDNYVGVWHLGESALPLRESSRTSSDFSFSNGTGIEFASSGIVGGSVDFGDSGNSRSLSALDHDALDGFQKFTIEAWTYMEAGRRGFMGGADGTDLNKGLLAKRLSSTSQSSYYLYDTGSATQLYGSLNGTSSSLFSSNVKAASDAWTHQVYTFDGSISSSNVEGWKDGVSAGKTTRAMQSINAGTANLVLGNFSATDARNFPGKIDELRISKVVRSGDWIKATYNTVTRGDFATYEVGQPGVEEQIPWYTNGVIACSIPDYTRESDDQFLYVFTADCLVRALTNLHIKTTTPSGETDRGYFMSGERLSVDVPASGTLGLVAEPIDPADIPSAEVSPSGEYTVERHGVYTEYVFTGDGWIDIDTPGVADIVIVGPNGGDTVELKRVLLNDGGSIIVNDYMAGFGRYLVSAGMGSSSGSVRVRVWKGCALSVESVAPSKATLVWGVMDINGTADIRLQYGTSKSYLTNSVMLAADAAAGAGGTVDVTGLDPETTYYARLYKDSGSGYAAIGDDAVSFTTAVLLSEASEGKVVTVSQPPVPGLNAGYSGTTNIVNIATNDSRFGWIDWDVRGVIASTNRGSATTTTAFPPMWANYRTWVFTGYMYFDGEHYYQFGEMIDDQTLFKIDGDNKINDTAWNTWGKCCVKPTQGWHAIEVRFANAGGGSGYSGAIASSLPGTIDDYITDKNDLKTGFGYAQVDSQGDPANMRSLEWLCDPGDGSLLRKVLQPEAKICITGFEVDVNGHYTVSVSNCMNEAVSGTLYYGDSADINALTNSSNVYFSSAKAIELGAGETGRKAIEWESDTPPYYVLVFPGIGESEVTSLAAGTRVAASVKSIGADSAVITTAVGFDLDVSGDSPSATLTAYYGCVGSGTGASAAALWLGLPEEERRSQVFGTVKAGTYDFTLGGLDVGSNYIVRVKSVDEGGNEAWSAPMKISVSGVYMGDGVEVYESDPRQQKLTVHRAGDASSSLTVFLEYSGGGVGSVSKLPRSVVLEAGSTSADIPFTVTDNTRKDGDRSFAASITAGSTYVSIAPSSATVTIIDDESAPGEVVTWTGAKDLNWADADNWDKDHAPRSVDTACFAGTGVTAGMTVDLSVSAGIRVLHIESPLSFTIGGSGSLAVNRVERTDTDGAEEGLVSIAVPVVAGNAENNYTIWDVEGSSGIELTGGLSAADGIKFLKDGDGGLWLSAADTAYSGPWNIYGGTVYANAASAIKGDIMIGAGETAAELRALVDNAIAPSSSPSVYTNGTLVAREADDASLASMLIKVYEGGLADLGEHFSANQAQVEGGRITGEMFSRSSSNQRLTASNSGITSVFDADYRIAAGGPFEIKVDDGASAVDLEIGGRVYYNGNAKSDQYFTKFGSGTMRTTKDWTGMSLAVQINGGRILVDNPSADGLGNQAVRVDAGATLGGTGFIGGTTASYETSSAVTVEGEGNNEGEIAPGTVDADGKHVLGTLTVGSQAKSGSVDFGDYTKFTVNIGADGTSDLLMVYGTATIANGAGTKLVIVCDDPSPVDISPRVVLRATGGLTGTFHSVTTPAAGWKVVYTSKEILVVPPQPGRRFIIR